MLLVFTDQIPHNYMVSGHFVTITQFDTVIDKLTSYYDKPNCLQELQALNLHSMAILKIGKIFLFRHSHSGQKYFSCAVNFFWCSKIESSGFHDTIKYKT